MSRHIRHFAAVGLAALLASCFESAQPLIAANEAEFPFGQTVRYTFYEWDKERRTWQPNETGTIRREADHYLQLDDGGRIGDALGWCRRVQERRQQRQQLELVSADELRYG